ncbi:LuxR C-terminal-related transcriptional regulator, partial [Nocardia sp. NPDC057455]|uniref:LuxR C-terminal-related transcriptional regulator n=1 Tax=Nocardia sp. NPDC057455 TaxID=3346138 RepID=UPI00366B86CF
MVQIPDYFPQWLTDLVLGHFPEGDPEAMRRSADTWSDAANGLVVVLRQLQPTVEQLEKAVEGETGTEIQKQYRKIIDQIQAQIEFNNAMARQLYDNATAIEYQQYVLIGIAGALLAQVIIDMAMPPPGSIVKAIADRAEARAGMELAKRDLVLTMLTRAARFVTEHPRLVLASKGVFLGTAIGGGVPYLAQRVQIAQGHRKAVDWQQVKIGAAAGAVGGLVGVEVGRRVAPAAMRVGGRVLGTVAAGGVGGMAGGLAGGLTAFALTEGEMRGKDLATMVWTGFGSGLVGSLGASVRAARAGAYTGMPGRGVSSDSGLPPDSAGPLTRISASGDGQPPQTRTASPEGISTTSEVGSPRARGPEAGFGDGSVDRPDGLTPEMMAEGEQIFRDLFDNATGSERNDLARFLTGDGPGPLPDGNGGTALPGHAPNHPSGGPSQPSSPGRGGSFPAWGDTAVARSSAAVAAPPEGGSATPMQTRQFRISDPQVRPDQRGIDVITEGTVTQSDIPTFGAEVLDGSGPYTDPFMIEQGADGTLYMVSPPEQTAGNGPDLPGPRPAGATLEEGAPAHEGQPLLDVDAEFARMTAELTSNPQQPDAIDPTVSAPAQKPAVDVTPPVSPAHDANNPLVPPSAPKQEVTPPAATARPAADANNPVAQTNPPRPGTDANSTGTNPVSSKSGPGSPPSASTHPAPDAGNSVAHPPSTPDNPHPAGRAGTETAQQTRSPGEPSATSAQATAGRTPSAASPLNPLPYAGAAALSGHTPDGPTGHTSTPTPPTGSPTNDHGETPQPATTPPAPVAATGRPDSDDEPDADPEEFPTPPGTVVDDPREHNVQKDPREHSVWQDPRDHSVQKKPSGDYVTIPGVSYPLEDEPPDNAIPVIPRPPALTPLPIDSVGLGRAYQNPDNPDSTSPRPPDITNPLSDRHLAAPETGLDAGLGKPPASLAMPSRYATEPNPEAPGAPQKPSAPQLNPHSLEYDQDPSRLPAVGGVPHLQPAPQPQGKRQRKRLVTQMGAAPDDKSRRRKKQPPPPPQPPPESPTKTPVFAPTPGVRSDAKNSDDRSSHARRQQTSAIRPVPEQDQERVGLPRDFTRVRDGITAAYRQIEGAGELHPVSQALGRMDALDLAILGDLSPLVRRRVIDVVSAVENGREISPLQGDAIKTFVRLLPMEPLDSTGTLTDLEFTELQLVAEDKSLREIGVLLGLKETTVRAHLGRIEHKLGAADRVTAVVTAIRSGILPHTRENHADPAHSPLPELTPREIEVLTLVADGESSPRIAAALTISVDAVNSHADRIGDKLGTSTRAGMVAVAVSTGILSPTVEAADPNAVLPKLNARELEVLALVAAGMTSAEIAAEVGLTQQTVESYASRTNRKLGVGTRAASVAVAIRTGILPPRPVVTGVAEAAAGAPDLTPREAEVLAHVAAGKDDNEIAEALGVTRQSAKTYVYNINQKLGTHHRAGMAAAALRAGLLPFTVSADSTEGDTPPEGGGAAPVGRRRTGPPHGAVDAYYDLDQDAALGLTARNHVSATHIPRDVPRWAMGFNRNPDSGAEWGHAAMPPDGSNTQQPDNGADIAAQRARELRQQLQDTVMRDWPVGDHAEAAEAVIAALLGTAQGTAVVRATNGGEGHARWVSVEVTDQSRETPARDEQAVPQTDSGRAIELVERLAGTWGFELRANGERTRYFTLFASPGQTDPSKVTSEPAAELVLERGEVQAGTSRARRMIGDLLERAGADDRQIDDVQLAVSEVVGNVGLYAKQGGAAIRAWLIDDVLRVEVADTSRGLPKWRPESAVEQDDDAAPLTAVDRDAEEALLAAFTLTELDAADSDPFALGERAAGTHGRGSGIIAELTTARGVDLARDGQPGKTVWMEIRLSRPSVRDEAPGGDRAEALTSEDAARSSNSTADDLERPGQPGTDTTLHRAKRGDAAALRALRDQYGRDTFNEVLGRLGVPAAPSRDTAPLVLLAQEVNGIVFGFADTHRWPVPEESDVGEWLRGVAGEIVDRWRRLNSNQRGLILEAMNARQSGAAISLLQRGALDRLMPQAPAEPNNSAPEPEVEDAETVPVTLDPEATAAAERLEAERRAAVADVARELGVGTDIVEMVLRGRSAVAEQAVAQVREAAERLGYWNQVTKPDVARAADVSLTTVDKVLGNGRGSVDDHTRQLVLTVAAEIGYTGRITRAAVARAAGVGVSTVEKVLRDGPVLTSDTADAVRDELRRRGLLQPPSDGSLPRP